MKHAGWRQACCGIVWLVVGVLLTGCGALPVPTSQPEITLVVRGDVAASGTWDADRLRSLGIMGLVAIEPNGEEVTYQGVLLKDLLNAVEPAPDATQVIFTSSDDTSVEMPLDEARACEECLVAFGPWGSELHLAMPGQPARLWVRRLISIEVQ